MNRCSEYSYDERGRQAAGSAEVRRDVSTVRTDGRIVYSSEAIGAVLEQLHLVAPTTATVLLLGETGVGKEIFAEAIHQASPRRHLPLVRLSCAAIPATLIERELFGHERGAFTDALARHIGRFEAANGSTLFLDEIGELPLEMQVKLLRVLQERTIERLGGTRSIKLDVRIVAATNRNLEEAIAAREFREDLFYRLNVFPITIPPLRARVDDIRSLVWAFIDELSPSFGKRIDAISRRSLEDLERYPWPGNVRELRNVIERELILAQGSTLLPTPPPARQMPIGRDVVRLDEAQTTHIRGVLDSCGWRIRGSNGAAERLGVKPTTLESQMARLGIVRNNHRVALRVVRARP